MFGIAGLMTLDQRCVMSVNGSVCVMSERMCLLITIFGRVLTFPKGFLSCALVCPRVERGCGWVILS